jgi:hypothetical protein
MVRAYSYDESLGCLTEDKWKTLGVEDKIGVLQSVENEMAAREHRYPCEVTTKPMPSEEGSVVFGGYDPVGKGIVINSQQLEAGSEYGDNCSEHLDTILHEGRHAYQDQAVDGLIEHEDKDELSQWRDNKMPGHYIKYEQNPRRYMDQPIERDARAFAADRKQQIQGEQAEKAKAGEAPAANDAKSEYMRQVGGIDDSVRNSSAAKADYLSQRRVEDASEKEAPNSEGAKRGIGRR